MRKVPHQFFYAMQYYLEDVRKVYELALPALIYYAQEIHRRTQVADTAFAETFPQAVQVEGDSADARVNTLVALANLDEQPEAVAISPRKGEEKFEIARLVATARIIMPKTAVCVCANAGELGDELQALCACAGANSFPSGEKLFPSLGLNALEIAEHRRKMRGCKGDGSCGGEGCKGDGSCGRHHHH